MLLVFGKFSGRGVLKSGANNRNLEEGKGIRLNEKSGGGLNWHWLVELDLAPYSVQKVPSCPALSLLLTLSVLKLKSFSFCFCLFSVLAVRRKFCAFLFGFIIVRVLSLYPNKNIYLLFKKKWGRERERQYCSHTCKLRGNTNHTAFHRNRNRQTAFFFNTYGLI